MNIVTSITNVFGEISTWIVGQLGAVQELFWSADSGSLTFLGVLAIVGVGIACALMLINTVRSFLHFG